MAREKSRGARGLCWIPSDNCRVVVPKNKEEGLL